MTTALEIAARRALYAALAAEVGIAIRTEDSLRAKAVLYRFRKELNDEALTCIQVRFSPDDPDHEIWLLRRSSTNKEE